MNTIRIIHLLAIVLISTFSGATAVAYDATANFFQDKPELVSGWNFKSGSTKGGPYPVVTDCGKPTAKADGSYDCVAKGLTANPLYGVVANYDSAKKEIATSSEATMTITVPPPSGVKIALVVTTVSRLTKAGNVIASTTIKRKEVASGTIIKEGSSGYRNIRGEYVTNTTIALLL